MNIKFVSFYQIARLSYDSPQILHYFSFRKAALQAIALLCDTYRNIQVVLVKHINPPISVLFVVTSHTLYSQTLPFDVGHVMMLYFISKFIATPLMFHFAAISLVLQNNNETYLAGYLGVLANLLNIVKITILNFNKVYT